MFDDGTIAEIYTGLLIPRSFVLMHFDEGDMGVWNDAGNITVNGVTYNGDCVIAGIDGIAGRSDLSMTDVSVVLNGADPAVAAAFMIMTWHLRRIEVMGLLFDAAQRTAFVTPIWRHVGLMEKATVEESDTKPATITLKVADLLQRSVIGTQAYFTDGSQRARLATDSALRYLSTITRPEDVPWGTRQAKAGNAWVHGLPMTKG